MAIYKFRVTFEDMEDVYRDIEIHSESTFADLHYAILTAINFDSIHKGMFFDSDNTWRRGESVVEITPQGMKGRAEKEFLADYIFDPRQRFVYRYDEKELWTFTVELIKLWPDDNRPLPKCVNTVGAAPKQYKEAPLKFKSTDEPDGRKLRKKKEVKSDTMAPVFEDEDDEDDDEEDTGKTTKGKVDTSTKKGFFGEPDVEEEEEEVDDTDAYEHEGEEFEVEEDEKEDVFSGRKAAFADDDDDADDDDAAGDDDDEFGGGFADSFDEGDDY